MFRLPFYNEDNITKGEINMKKLTIRLETLTCPSCVKKIEGALARQQGVEHVRVLFHASKVVVDYDDTKMSKEDVKAIITKLGFTVRSLQEAS